MTWIRHVQKILERRVTFLPTMKLKNGKTTQKVNKKLIWMLSSVKRNMKGRLEYFMEPDKSTKWYKKPSLRRRRLNHNIITNRPGVKGAAKNAKTASESWGNLFPDELLEIKVTDTNQYIDAVKDDFTRERDGKSI
ncbi:hypothetical protein HHI36_022854 [Cryptolaemus montrouzieri]|uniref:Uncharacterized protein n=1 Tax=Cryptolaemus montrouzieri TaxID=559131 RepID=A0ABD2PEL9_9CUCU